MTVDIPLTPEEEARLNAEASQIGLSLGELLKRRAFQRLPPTPKDVEEKLNAHLRRLQEESGVKLEPHVPAHELFAKWDEEDANMTEEEREKEARLWEEIERGLIENRGLRLRTLED